MDPQARDARRRLIIAALAVVAVFAVMVAALIFLGSTANNTDSGADSTAPDSTVTTSPVGESPTEDQSPLAEIYEIPETTNPQYFARRFTEALVTYDTRYQTLTERRDALREWITTVEVTSTREELFEGLDDWLPTPSMWSAMTASELRQIVKVTRVEIPDEMRKAHREAIERNDPLAGSQILWVTVDITTFDDTGYAIRSSDVMVVGVRCPLDDGALCAAIGVEAPSRAEREGEGD